MRAQLCGVALLTGIVVMACGSKPHVPTDGAITAYLQEVDEWAPEEAEVGRGIRRVLESRLVDEAEVRQQLSELEPRINAQIERMAAYQPPAGLDNIHNAYVEAWRHLAGGCRDIEEGFDSGDQGLLAHGQQALRDWQHALPAVAEAIRDARAAESNWGSSK